jgi:hypothetical protein
VEAVGGWEGVWREGRGVCGGRGGEGRRQGGDGDGEGWGGWDGVGWGGWDGVGRVGDGDGGDWKGFWGGGMGGDGMGEGKGMGI